MLNKREVVSGALGIIVLIGAACSAPLPEGTGAVPATSVVLPELLVGGQQPTPPALSPAVAVSPLSSPLAVVSPDAVIPASASPSASPSLVPFHPVLPSGSPAAPSGR